MALKLQKSAAHYTEAAMDEIEFLDKVSFSPFAPSPPLFLIVSIWTVGK